MVHLKRSIIEVKAKSDCLAHALILAIARITNDRDYNSNRKGYKILQKVKQLLQTTGISQQHVGGIQELQRFQDHFSEYRIVVYGGVDCRDIIFDGQGTSEKRINQLYDDVNRHYHVIANLTGAMVKRYVYKALTRDVRQMSRTSLKRHLMIACPFHHAYIHTFESRASLVTERSEVNRALISIRLTN